MESCSSAATEILKYLGQIGITLLAVGLTYAVARDGDRRKRIHALNSTLRRAKDQLEDNDGRFDQLMEDAVVEIRMALAHSITDLPRETQDRLNNKFQSFKSAKPKFPNDSKELKAASMPSAPEASGESDRSDAAQILDEILEILEPHEHPGWLAEVLRSR